MQFLRLEFGAAFDDRYSLDLKNLEIMSDHIRLSTVCLCFCTLMYAALAAELHNRSGAAGGVGIAIGAYALGLYLVMGVLAIDLKKWAWRVANVAFIIHLFATIALVIPATQRGKSGIAYVAVWCGLGVVGLWANLRPASRAVLDATT